MEFKPSEIATAIKELFEAKKLTNDKIMEVIKTNIKEKKIVYEDVKDVVKSIYPDIYDEDNNIVSEYDLMDEYFLKEIEQHEAKKYLLETDWIIAKIGENQFVGQDVTEMLKKYKTELDKRAECRQLL